jgi:hypothetical protein
MEATEQEKERALVEKLRALIRDERFYGLLGTTTLRVVTAMLTDQSTEARMELDKMEQFAFDCAEYMWGSHRPSFDLKQFVLSDSVYEKATHRFSIRELAKPAALPYNTLPTEETDEDGDV